MNLKERIAEILKEAFGAPVITPAPAPSTALATPAAPAAPVMGAPVPYTLQDGTPILVVQAGQVPAVGDTVANADGTTPAAGVLTLQDGSTLTIDDSGLVTEVGAAAPVTTDLAAPLIPTLEERVAQIEALIVKAQQPARMSEVSKADFDALKAENAKFKKAIEDLSGVVSEIGEMPTAEPVTLNESQKERFKRVDELEEKEKSGLASYPQLKRKKQYK